MSTVRTNTLANYVGQAWIAVVGVIFVPIYIRYIGIEAYGIVGFFVVLQSLFAILDMGLSATLNRELARRSGQPAEPEAVRDLVRTLEWLCWPTGLLIALVVWAVSGPLAEHWLNPVALSVERAAGALLLLGLATALQWPVSFYTGGLSGLQRQVQLNLIAAGFATVRAVGAIGVLALVAPTIEAFLWWQVALSAVQSITYMMVTWHALPAGSRTPAFRGGELRRIGVFAAGITGITILSFLLTQTDRIVLSRLLTLEDFGVYAFAASVAYALFRLVQPIVTAVYPRYSQLVAAGSTDELVAFYHRTNQVMAAALLPVAAVGAAFAHDILRIWTADATLAAAAAPIMTLLVAGTAMNGLMNLPYAMQLAYGMTALGFWINLVSVLLVVPAVWLAGRQFGGVGAASVWVALNLGYLCVAIPLMHRRLLIGEMSKWYLSDVLPPLLASATVVLAWRFAVPDTPDGILGLLLLLAVAGTTMAASLAASRYPRQLVRNEWVRWRTPGA